MLKTEGIVLSEIRYRDSSKILKIYTRKFGKIHVMAKGAYRPKSQLIATTQPFSHNEYIFGKGRNFYYLNQASVLNPFYEIRENIERFLYASYILELVEKSTLEEEANQKIYFLLLKALCILSKEKKNFRRLIISFSIKYISFLGYRPNLDSCSFCGQSHGDIIRFSYSEGGLICENCFLNDYKAKAIDKYNLAAMKALLYRPMDKLDDIVLSESSLQILESIIEDYVLYNIERKSLNSLKILKTLD